MFRKCCKHVLLAKDNKESLVRLPRCINLSGLGVLWLLRVSEFVCFSTWVLGFGVCGNVLCVLGGGASRACAQSCPKRDSEGIAQIAFSIASVAFLVQQYLLQNESSFSC